MVSREEPSKLYHIRDNGERTFLPRRPEAAHLVCRSCGYHDVTPSTSVSLELVQGEPPPTEFQLLCWAGVFVANAEIAERLASELPDLDMSLVKFERKRGDTWEPDNRINLGPLAHLSGPIYCAPREEADPRWVTSCTRCHRRTLDLRAILAAGGSDVSLTAESSPSRSGLVNVRGLGLSNFAVESFAQVAERTGLAQHLTWTPIGTIVND